MGHRLLTLTKGGNGYGYQDANINNANFYIKYPRDWIVLGLSNRFSQNDVPDTYIYRGMSGKSIDYKSNAIGGCI